MIIYWILLGGLGLVSWQSADGKISRRLLNPAGFAFLVMVFYGLAWCITQFAQFWV